MAGGLFETSEPAAAAELPPLGDGYRSFGGVTIAAAVLALLSPLGFIDWWLLVVPVLAAVLGLVGWRDILARPDVLTGKLLAIGSMVVGGLLFAGGFWYQATVYARELPPGFERLNYAALQPGEGEPANLIPESAVKMHDRDVLLKGYMYPGKQQRGIRQFLLVRDQGDCCFGGNPKITDRVLVQMADKQTIEYTPRLRKIAGRFSIRPTGAVDVDGGVFYHLEDARVR
ncbi:MAG: hypothetical protein EXS06_05160 [Planctomycetaceae bacterium]|nr:hypothetical protein [Planctomycetaceae bacterium]